MLCISWNVNGLRACLGKGFLEFFQDVDADFFTLQETKLQEHQIELTLPGYYQFWNSALKKGYAGTAIFAKQEPLAVSYGLGREEHDQEGRVITLDYEKFFLVTVYTPNAQRELARLVYRQTWDDAFRNYVAELDRKKPVIICGDLNVAHQEIDLKNPRTNHRNPGFTDEERGKMSALLNVGFADTFRTLYPDRKEAYTWWSYLRGSRSRNAGWRIDYFLVSSRLVPRVDEACIYSHVMGSDHCPVGLVLT